MQQREIELSLRYIVTSIRRTEIVFNRSKRLKEFLEICQKEISSDEPLGSPLIEKSKAMEVTEKVPYLPEICEDLQVLKEVLDSLRFLEGKYREYQRTVERILSTQ